MVLERFDRMNPIMSLDYLSVQHISRYLFACNKLDTNVKVLDIACGTGYGTAMLRECGVDVIGGDIDNNIILQACEAWNYEKFEYADALNLRFSENYFDAVVSFETIEHVEDIYKYLHEMKRVLKPNGIFICSTPNIKYTAHPLFHIKEFTPQEFYKLIEEEFVKVERYGQYFTRFDRIKDLMKWSTVNIIVGTLEVFRIKKVVKKIINNNAKKKINKVENVCDLVTEEVLETAYSVHSLDTYQLLRNMIVVARK